MTQAPTEDLLRRAPFVFRGRVESINATTTAAFPASDRTAVVQVLELVRAPAAFSRLEGQNVTVELARASELDQGQTAIFYARGRLLADGIVVEEVGHQPVTGAAAAADELRGALVNQANESLRAHLDQADAVIVGRVSSVRPSTVATATASLPGRVSEHDPLVSEAVVAVESVLKGSLVSDAVVVLFSASIDVAHYKSPKYHAGQHGVFLLHSEPVPVAAVDEFGAVFATSHPGDFLPTEAEGRVQSLLSESTS